MAKTLSEDGKTKLSKWGNSNATRIPRNLVEQLGWKDNEDLSINIENNSLVLKPISDCPSNIHELFAGWEDDGKRDTEIDWGESKGNELKW